MPSVNLIDRLRDRLREREHVARKSLGQNFLLSAQHLEGIADEIAAACSAGLPPSAKPRGVFEPGPGPGNLTQALLQRGLNVYAVELDRAFSDLHAEAFAEEMAANRLTFRHGDALKADPRNAFDWLKESGANADGLVVAGNIPYQITSPLIYQFLRWLARGVSLSALVILVQEEVARRAMAVPGDSDYGSLSAKIGVAARARMGLKVPPSAFWPQPKVLSRLLIVEPLPLSSRPPVAEMNAAWELIDHGFQHRRKMAAKTLGAKRPERRPIVEEWLRGAGLSEKARPEELSSDQWLDLARVLARTGDGAGESGSAE